MRPRRAESKAAADNARAAGEVAARHVEILHRAADLLRGHLDPLRAGGTDRGQGAADRAVSGDRAADRHHHRQLSRRQRGDAREDGGRADRGAALRRREPHLLQLQLRLQRRADDHRHLRGRHRRQQGGRSTSTTASRSRCRGCPTTCGATASSRRSARPTSCSSSRSPRATRATTRCSCRNYATVNVLDELKRVPGVADATIFGARDYSMRIWLRPDKMATLGVTTTDVANAIRAQNNQYAAGKIGQEPAPRRPVARLHGDGPRAPGRAGGVRQHRPALERPRRHAALRRTSPASSSAPQPTTRSPRSTASRRSASPSSCNRAPMRSTSPTGARAAMDRAAEVFPQGVSYVIPFDTTRFVQASIHEVDQDAADRGRARASWSCSSSCRAGARR